MAAYSSYAEFTGVEFPNDCWVMNAATTTVEFAPAPAVMRTMILAVVFFSTQLVMAAYSSYAEVTGVEFPNDCWDDECSYDICGVRTNTSSHVHDDLGSGVLLDSACHGGLPLLC